MLIVVLHLRVLHIRMILIVARSGPFNEMIHDGSIGSLFNGGPLSFIMNEKHAQSPFKFKLERLHVYALNY